jgi:hypothetical protein
MATMIISSTSVKPCSVRFMEDFYTRRPARHGTHNFTFPYIRGACPPRPEKPIS